MHGGQKSTDLSGGVLVAETELNRNIYDVLNQTGAYVGQKNAIFSITARTLLTPPSPYVVKQGAREYTCNLFVEGVYDPGGAPAIPNRLVRFDVEVQWSGDPGSPFRTGQGRLSTSLSRFVNEFSQR